MSMDNNSTIFTFANLSNVDTSKIFIKSQPTQYAVQVRRAEMVRFQTLVDGMTVENTNVLIEDALGNDLYSLYTDQNGYTPWFALASDSHLDFRGLSGGDNPDGFADDEYEDSCSDGIDNDGDLTIDGNDLDVTTVQVLESYRVIFTLHIVLDLVMHVVISLFKMLHIKIQLICLIQDPLYL